ncbi:hypothetical protein [Lentzea sp. E54]|uniref:hypothetical protein n=1 Tax=Lentzea xerophila TaxID=3435883 RepID=UPI003DA28A2E
MAENAPLFDTGDKITLGAMIIALLAMGVAIWQACEARKSRKATEEQADTAKKVLGETEKQSAAAEKSATAAMLSLGSTERAAGAAEEQVVLARQAVQTAKDQVVEARKAVEAAEAQVVIAMRAAEAAERSARAGENANELAQREAHKAMAPKFQLTHYRGTGLSDIRMVMTDGPRLSVVTVRPQGRNAELVQGFTMKGSSGPPVAVLELEDMHKGDTYELVVHHPQVPGTTTIAIDLHCVPVNQDVEPWTVTETFELVPPVRVATARFSRGPQNPGRGLFHDGEQL